MRANQNTVEDLLCLFYVTTRQIVLIAFCRKVILIGYTRLLPSCNLPECMNNDVPMKNSIWLRPAIVNEF